MKRSIFFTGVLAAIYATLLLTGCAKDDCKNSYTYTKYKPVYMSYEDLRSSVATESPRTLKSPGKIWVYGSYLFINEFNEGIHVINNSDPSNPSFVSFIKIPGNIDMAVKGNFLFVDSYTDLVVLDISNPASASEVGREEGIFENYTALYAPPHPDSGVIVDWEEELVTEVFEEPCSGGQPYVSPIIDFGGNDVVTFTGSEGPMTTNGLFSSNETGVMNQSQGGSMARFALSQQHLYVVGIQSIRTFDISSPTDPVPGSETQFGWGVETIFPYGNNLFIGSTTGMYIMDIQNPDNPVHISTYEHVNSCDPVVVDGNYAYVTLRSGTDCQGFTNQLDVVDISDLGNPTLAKTFQMHNPHGLGVDQSLLFLCDGSEGLKVFDNSNPLNVGNEMRYHYNDIQAFDVIPFNDVLMMIGQDGLFQYDYSDPANVIKLSEILANP